VGSAGGVLAGLIAGITLKYTYDKLIHEKQMHKKLRSISMKTFERSKIQNSLKIGFEMSYKLFIL